MKSLSLPKLLIILFVSSFIISIINIVYILNLRYFRYHLSIVYLFSSINISLVYIYFYTLRLIYKIEKNILPTLTKLRRIIYYYMFFWLGYITFFMTLFIIPFKFSLEAVLAIIIILPFWCYYGLLELVFLLLAISLTIYYLFNFRKDKHILINLTLPLQLIFFINILQLFPFDLRKFTQILYFCYECRTSNEGPVPVKK
jgi:hypothetical protein